MLRLMNCSRTAPSSSNQGPRTERGFTLVEMLIVVAIMGMILAISIPALRRSMVRAELIGEAKMLKAAVSVSRINAIKQSRTVVLRILLDDAAQNGGLVHAWIDDNPENDALDAGEEDVGRWRLNDDITLSPDAGLQLRGLSGTELGIVFLPSGAAIANTGGTVVGAGAVVVSDFAFNQIRISVQGGSGTVVQEMWDFENSLWSDQMRFWRY